MDGLYKRGHYILKKLGINFFTLAPFASGAGAEIIYLKMHNVDTLSNLQNVKITITGCFTTIKLFLFYMFTHKKT